MAVAEVPEELSRLRDIARNVWWCWHDKAKALFMALSPSHWESWRNPLKMLEQADPERFRDLLEAEDVQGMKEKMIQSTERRKKFDKS